MISSQYSLPDYDLVRKLARSVGYNDHRWLAWQLDLSSWLPPWLNEVQSQHSPYLQCSNVTHYSTCTCTNCQSANWPNTKRAQYFHKEEVPKYTTVCHWGQFDRGLYCKKPKLNLTYKLTPMVLWETTRALLPKELTVWTCKMAKCFRVH